MSKISPSTDLVKGDFSGKSPADRLTRLALKAVDLFCDCHGAAYGKVRINASVHVFPVRSKAFSDFLASQYYILYRTVPGAGAIDSALAVLEGFARYQCPVQAAFRRLGWDHEAIYLFLGGEDGLAVRITAEGWSLAEPAVHFVRTPGQLPLPPPDPDGDLNLLRQYLPVSEESFILLVAWLLGALHPTGPYPIVVLRGDRGAGKSTTARLLKSLLDPGLVTLQAVPGSELDLIIAAQHSHILVFDNLSNLAPWLSDALCRLATGGGLRKRRLYSNDDEVLFDAKKPIVLNGIGAFITRQDLADRCIFIHHDPIPDCGRKTEAAIFEGFQRDLPKILGGLCTAASVALNNRHQTNLPALPRMADFALWVCAGETALPWEPGTFLKAYEANRLLEVEDHLHEDPVASSILRLVDEQGSWQGTISQLLEELESLVPAKEVKSRFWPGTAKRLGRHLARLEVSLRAVGLELRRGKDSKGNRILQLTKLP